MCNSDRYKMMVMCDDETTIYMDGEEKKNVAGAGECDEVAILHIPTSTSVVGIKCINTHGYYGIMVRITDKEEAIVAVSDSSWTCSNKEETGWSTGSFKEDESWEPASDKTYQNPWGNPPFQEQVIWTASLYDSTVFCRKVLPGHLLC